MNVFDAIIFGTGLTESILAAALSKAGFKIAHVDNNSYYGGDEASLSFDELIEWADSHLGAPSNSQISNVSRSKTTLPNSRQYSFSLSPSVIPSAGPLISSLISSGVARYGGFKLLETVAIYEGIGTVRAVPNTKQQIFKAKELSLVDRRRLMRFLMFAASDFEEKQELQGKQDMSFLEFLKEAFSLSERIAQSIAFASSCCVSIGDLTLPALKRLKRYLQSTGRYGPSPFIVGHYGGTGEIAQGFCRVSAVNGGVYILGRKILSVKENESKLPQRYSVQLDNFPEELQADLIVSSKRLIPANFHQTATAIPSSDDNDNHPFVRCIAVIDKPLLISSASADVSEEEDQNDKDENVPKKELDSGVIVFPPSSVIGGSADTSVSALISGAGSMSTPPGNYILHITLPSISSSDQSPEHLLQPYLNAILSLSSEPTPIKPTFTLFYKDLGQELQGIPSNPPGSSFIATPSPSNLPPELPDSCVRNAESVFWEILKVFKASRKSKGDEKSDDLVEVNSFWPPVEADPQNDEW